MKESLQETAVANAITTRWIGRVYHYFSQVGSTNDLLKTAARANSAAALPAGAVYLTDYQAQGRGRLDRRWEASPGTSILHSILFRPHWPAERLPWLTMLAGLAAAEAIEAHTNLTVALKWPNDVVLWQETSWHKVGGILLEGEISPQQRLEYAILGMGLNVNIPAQQLPPASTPATSLLAAIGAPVSRLALLMTLWERLESHYDAAEGGESPQAAWHARLTTIGQAVTVRRLDTAGELVGVAEGADEWGHLLVRDAAGQLHTISAGDVTLRQSDTPGNQK